MRHTVYCKVTKIGMDGFDILGLHLSSEFHTRKINVPLFGCSYCFWWLMFHLQYVFCCFFLLCVGFLLEIPARKFWIIHETVAMSVCGLSIVFISQYNFINLPFNVFPQSAVSLKGFEALLSPLSNGVCKTVRRISLKAQHKSVGSLNWTV